MMARTQEEQRRWNLRLYMFTLEPELSDSVWMRKVNTREVSG